MHRTHRQRVLDLLEDGDLALVPAARPVLRNHDVEHPFRQSSDFLYLTGFREHDAVLMLAKGIDELPDETMFVLPRDAAQETWTGRRCGPQGVVEQLGFEAADSLDDLDDRVGDALAHARRVWLRLGERPELDRLVLARLGELREQSRREDCHSPGSIHDPSGLLAELRLRKSAEELAWMRLAAAATAEGHLLAMAQAAPGVGEWELEALLNYTFRRRGGDGWAYPPIVAGGVNACILHYTESAARLGTGDLVLVDAGAEFAGYASDVTRTFPVDGSFAPAQRDAYEVVLAAQEAGIAAVQPGKPFQDVHAAATRALAEGLRALGVLSEPIDAILERQLYRPWYMHSTSHWLGLDVHDAGRYRSDGVSRPLEEGMVLTVEPGLYFRPDDERVPAALRGLGIRIEDDVLVTGGGHEVLSAAVPKRIDEVEAACSAVRVMPPTLESELAIK
ncbi:MAG TPA: aminopeptidase P N-terminal domain-containing protein [Planctomycetota bacterium]